MRPIPMLNLRHRRITPSPVPSDSVVPPDPAGAPSSDFERGVYRRRSSGPQSWISYAPAGLSLLHLAAVYCFAGSVSAEHVAVDLLFVLLTFASSASRRFALSMLPIWITAVLYRDILPWALQFRGAIHVDDLYHAELRWFGIPYKSSRIIPCDYFRHHYSSLLDLVCAPFYIGFQVQLVLFATFLYFRSKANYRRLAISYLVVHSVGFPLHVIYPAAPPWYVEQYGLGPANLQATGDAAGLSRFDELTGTNLARTMYAHSSNVFGAMPSLHVSLAMLYPLIGRRFGRGLMLTGTTLAVLTIFGAVYFRHHYVWDVLVGILFAFIVYFSVGWMLDRYWPYRDDVARGAAT